MTSGFAALVGAWYLGPRKMPRSSTGDKESERASPPFVMLGTGMLWFGW